MKAPTILTNYIGNIATFCLILFLAFSQNTYSQLAFPTANGAGAYATGGRGGSVSIVTNLNDSGIGSLRSFSNISNTTIVFNVSGIINLSSELVFTGNNVTIAGQTAPEGGITIDGSRVLFSDSDNLICRYIRFRGGHHINNDTVGGYYLNNVIFDHCSFSFGGDEAFSILVDNPDETGGDITVQNCLIAESSTGGIMGGEEAPDNVNGISLIANVYYNISHRFPNLNSNSRYDIINNYVHNHNKRMIRGNLGYQVNEINNLYDYGDNRVWDKTLNHHGCNTGANLPLIYTSGNLILGNESQVANEPVTNTIPEMNADNSLMWKYFYDNNSDCGFGIRNRGDQLEPVFFSNIQLPILGESPIIYNALDLKNSIVPNAGASKRLNSDGTTSDNTDVLDASWKSNIMNGIYLPEILEVDYAVPLIPSVVRSLDYDADLDGMSDEWEILNFNSLENDGTTDSNGNGYSDLEDFLNQVDTGVTVSIPVESVALSPEITVLNVPETIELEKIFTPSDATNKSGIWSSSNEAIATVDGNGLVSSLTEGEVVITFVSNDGGFSASSQITVTNIVISPESVSIVPDAITLDLNESIQLSTQFVPVNTTITSGIWTSSDETVVTVDQNGLVSSIGEGQAIISFEGDEGDVIGFADVTVTDIFFGSYILYNADTDVIIQEIEDDISVNIADFGNQINFRCIPDGGDSNSNVESVEVVWNGPQNGIWTESVPLYAGLPGGHIGLDFEPYTVEEGTYDFTVTYFSEDGASGNIVAVDEFSITFFFSILPVANAGPDQDICQGESIILTASGGPNILWENGETTASIEVSPLETTTYTVSVYDNEGNFDEDSVTVTVNSIPVAEAGEDQTICEGETIILTASGGEEYLWSNGETTSTIAVSPTIDTVYNVEVITNNCSSIDSVTIFVNDAPNLTVSDDVIIVEGNSTVLSVNGGDNYLWSTGETSSEITVSPLETTSYSVSSTGLNGCSTSLQITVTVEPPFTASAGEDKNVCQNDTYEVELTAGEGDSYLWSTGETTQSIIVSPLSTTTYTVTVNSGSQVDSDDVTVFVDPNPNVIIVNGANVNIMNGDFVTLSATGANSYVWNNGATQPNIAVSPSQTTTYEVRGYINDCYDEKLVTVTVIPEVDAYAGEDVEICLGETVTLTATGGEEYEWSNGESTQSIQVSPDATTEYTVTVFNALDFDEDSVIVFVDDNCGDNTVEQPENPDSSGEFSFDVFPNPAVNQVNVRLSGSVALSRIYLYDITGKLIHSEIISNDNISESTTRTIDVSMLNPGMYYVKMMDINREISKKLIIN